MKFIVYVIGHMGKAKWDDVEDSFIMRDIKYNENDASRAIEELNRVKSTFFFYKEMLMKLTEI
jgi:hypothetical protein